MKRWNETSQDGGPIDSNVLSAILRQPHLLLESVVGSTLVFSSLSTVAPTIAFVVDAQAVKIESKNVAPSQSDVNIRANAKWVKSIVWHVTRCARIAAFLTAAVAKHRAAAA